MPATVPYAESVTAAMIHALSDEAAAAGDLEMVAICDQAIEGGAWSDAWHQCWTVIAAGQG